MQLEPLLVQYASHHNFEVRFSTELTDIEHVKGDDKAEFTCTVHDHVSHLTFKIRTRYLFGADGARSSVARSLGFKFLSSPSGGKACNVLLRADLDEILLEERRAGLHWILKPDRKTFPGLVAHLRAVRPWKEWVLVCFGPYGSEPFEGLTTESPELVDCVRELIGVESITIDILRLDRWTVRESVAEEFSLNDSHAFLLGDAAHRHPPAFGLGSNTCVQDAYNLAWKIAYVEKGIAGPSLLQSYSHERQPVGAMLVRESNKGIRAHSDIWEALGMFAHTREEGAEELAKLSEASREGAERRAKLQGALEAVGQEVRSLGAAYNQWYTSLAIYHNDERSARPSLEGNPILDVQISTHPGSRLPHAWLDIQIRGKLTSTHDLAGGGAFCLFLGIGGDAWRHAARSIAHVTGIPINVYGIGIGLDFVDVYGEWRLNRGVEEDGCVLVRPDRFIAWRSPQMVSSCEGKLMQILDSILSRSELHQGDRGNHVIPGTISVSTDG
jgi:2-polyprenyl-6-methoxyphenol hydroxylase-like FAD-dependent oxidoreductase